MPSLYLRARERHPSDADLRRDGSADVEAQGRRDAHGREDGLVGLGQTVSCKMSQNPVAGTMRSSCEPRVQGRAFKLSDIDESQFSGPPSESPESIPRSASTPSSRPAASHRVRVRSDRQARQHLEQRRRGKAGVRGRRSPTRPWLHEYATEIRGPYESDCANSASAADACSATALSRISVRSTSAFPLSPQAARRSISCNERTPSIFR